METNSLIKTFSLVHETMKSVLSAEQSVLGAYNQIGKVDGRIIGTGQADYTQDTTQYLLNIRDKKVVLFDIPGIEGNEKQFSRQIQNAIRKAHLVVYINDALKKSEQGTAQKIKNYLQHDTDVYVLYNVRCMPKKNRDKEIDGTYEEELSHAYRRVENNLVQQTKTVLQPILGEAVKGYLCINGLMGFCGYAFDKEENRTTIIDDTDKKSLQSEQKKFLKELGNKYTSLQELSRLPKLIDIVNNHVADFDYYIVENNKKRLLQRLLEMERELQDIAGKYKAQTDRIRGVILETQMESINAIVEYENDLGDIPRIVARKFKNTYLKEMYNLIKQRGDALKEDEIQTFFRDNESRMQASIQADMKECIETAKEVWRSKLATVKGRLSEDLKDIVKNNGTLDMGSAMGNVDINGILDSMEYTFKQLGEDALGIIGFTMAGFEVGAWWGAIVGFLVGLGMKIWGWFRGKEYRKSKAKENASNAFDKMESNVKRNLRDKLITDSLKQQFEKSKTSVNSECRRQQEYLDNINSAMQEVELRIHREIEKLRRLEYGKI